MDDVGHFQYLVEQGDVSVRKVDGCSGCCAEVVRGSDTGGDDQVIDDFSIDFCDHFIGHEVGEGPFCVDVVYGFEVLCGFERPCGFELSCDCADRITVDAQGDFGLEWVVFEIELVVCSGDQAGN